MAAMRRSRRGWTGTANSAAASSSTASFGPSLSRSTSSTQYIAAVTDSVMTATYGRRYIFAGLEQTTASLDTRLNVNFTPELSLELFAQPFLSSADFRDLKQLRAARSDQFDVFGRDVGSISYDAESRRYAIDPGVDGARTFEISDRDFSVRSLRGNAVLRWEYRPGSALFLVWQQRRAETLARGDFAFRRDGRALFDATPDNIFVVKLSYWLNL